MNKKELIDAMASVSGLTKKDSGLALDAFIESVNSALERNDKVALAGFGTWEVKPRAERNGVNPKTKEKIVIPATKAVRFKAGKALKETAKA